MIGTDKLTRIILGSPGYNDKYVDLLQVKVVGKIADEIFPLNWRWFNGDLSR